MLEIARQVWLPEEIVSLESRGCGNFQQNIFWRYLILRILNFVYFTELAQNQRQSEIHRPNCRSFSLITEAHYSDNSLIKIGK